ncbi:hypothetical protein DRQ32_04575 [bacterium]|nr:MAG: hypothetical protein DRQ32_04575 [bacterium]
MHAWLAGLLLLLAAPAPADEAEVFRVMPPGERVLQSGIEGISALMIVEGGGIEQGGRLQSDLRGRLRMEVGGILLELRQGEAFSIESETAEQSRLDQAVARRLELHDFFAIALQTRVVFDELSQADATGTKFEGKSANGESGTLYRDERGRVSGYDVRGSAAGDLQVRFIEWVNLGDNELPSRLRTNDSSGERFYRLSAFREQAMPEPVSGEAPRWLDEDSLPVAALAALAAERGFALASRLRGMKAAFLQWVEPGGTVFGPGPMTVEERFAGVPDEREKQPALEWLPEWIVISGSHDLAAISGRWLVTPAGVEHATDFGQYLSVWRSTADGWRVLADIGTDQEEHLPLTAHATGRVVQERGAGDETSADTTALAAQVEQTLQERAFRDGYAKALAALAVDDVIVLRVGAAATRGAAALSVQPDLADLAPRIELTGSASATAQDLLATWGIMHFEPVSGDSTRLAFLRVWERGPARWELVADIVRLMPRG